MRVGVSEHPGGGGYDLAFSTGNGNLDAAAEQMRITYSGNVGIGTNTPDAKLEVSGTTRTNVLEITGGSDLAEPFDVRSYSPGMPPRPGMVVAIDPAHPGDLLLAARPYDPRVAGVISGANGLAPGLVMKSVGQALADGMRPVAMSGRVWCWVDASYGPIHPGDLLTTSPTPGMAMIARDPARRSGAVLGKAMTSRESGRGLVLVLVTLQ